MVHLFCIYIDKHIMKGTMIMTFKKYVASIILAALAFGAVSLPVCAARESDVCKVYNLEGTETLIRKSELGYYIKNGWYEEPVCVIYSPNGSSSVVFQRELDYYLKNGWYAQPVCTVYTLDGISSLIYCSEIDYYLKNGWYNAPVCTIYSPSGVSSIIYKSELDYYLSNGWYNAPVCTIYSPNGISSVVLKTEIDYYLANGWYAQPVCMVYRADGASAIIYEYELDYYLANGWGNLMIPMYSSDGTEIMAPYIQIDIYKAHGWMTQMQYLCYSIDQAVAEYGYDDVINVIDEQLDYVEDEQIWMTLYEKREALMDEWLIGNGAPLAVTDWWIEEEYGIPEAWIQFRNLSDKTITAFKVYFVCYDAYGNVTTDYPSLYDGSNVGVVERETFYPGESNAFYMKLYSNEQTASISRPYVTQIAFSDGTTWYR